MEGTIVCFGDSNTYGYDPREFGGGRYPEKIRWTGILKRETGLNVINSGLCGREIPSTSFETEAVCRLAEEWRKEASPVRLWVMLGVNDLLKNGNFTAEDAAARMEVFLQNLQETPAVREGGIKLRLIAPPPVWYGTWVTEERIYRESRRLDFCYSGLAGRHGIRCTETGDWDIPVAFDGVHFSEEGHLKFAENILKQNRL